MNEQVRDKILSASNELFRMYGIRSTSMDDIAHKMGMSKKTLYQYFTSKEELLTAGTTQVIEQLLNQFKLIADTEEDALIKISRIYYNILKELTHFELVYLHTIDMYSNKVSELLISFRQNILKEYVIPMLEESQIRGWVKPEIDLNLVAKIYFHRLDLSYADAVNFMHGISLPHLFSHLVALPIMGICTTEKAQELNEKLNQLIKEVSDS